MSRTLVIGDIHGCSRALDVLLAAVNPHGDDRIVTLGDYIDRGPDSAGVLDRLLALRKTGRLVALRGNHEDLMLKARGALLYEEMWLLIGGGATLASYGRGGRPGTLDDVPVRHWHLLESVCVLQHEIDTHFFVHGGVLTDVPLAEQPEFTLLWERFRNPPPHVSGKVMVCGHTSQKGKPRNLGHAVCIDTRAYHRGWLTCLDATSGQIWQANQRGRRRTAHLDDFLIP